MTATQVAELGEIALSAAKFLPHVAIRAKLLFTAVETMIELIKAEWTLTDEQLADPVLMKKIRDNFSESIKLVTQESSN